jgi:phosphoribosylformylglycinamidine synthase subunit PurS
MEAAQAMPETSAERIWLAHVYVTLKTVVNDPQGLAIAEGLRTMGYEGVEDVRAGKYLQVRLRAADEATALRLAEEMSDRLLANMVLEDYRCTVEPLDAAGGDELTTENTENTERTERER